MGLWKACRRRLLTELVNGSMRFISDHMRYHLPWRVVNGLGTGASRTSAGFEVETGLTVSDLGASGERAMTGEAGAAT